MSSNKMAAFYTNRCQPPDYVELQISYRQDDADFLEILNCIRAGQVNLNRLNQQVIPASQFPKDAIVMCTTNKRVELLNNQALNRIRGKKRIYQATILGNFPEKDFPNFERIPLKVGARIMLIKNDSDRQKRYVNGTTGTVTKMREEEIEVETDEGRRIEIIPERWEIVRYEYDPQKKQLETIVVGSFTQLPIKLGWAVTIHKSQGQTYQKAVLDLGNGAFAHGQLYVALSRLTTLKGLFLKAPIKPDDVIVNQEVLNFHGAASR